MRIAVYAPLAFSILLAPPPLTTALRALPDRVNPRAVLVLLTTILATTAAATTVPRPPPLHAQPGTRR